MSPISLSLIIPFCGVCLALSSSSTRNVHHNAEVCGWPPNSLYTGDTCPLAIDENVGRNPTSWAPWTHHPQCVESASGKYCVFTNSLFRGRGVSVITTPELAAAASGLFDTRQEDVSLNNTGRGQRPYTIQELPGRGKGAIAKRRISRGEVFLVDYASVLADVEFPGRVKRSDGQTLLLSAMKQLPGEGENVLGLARSSTAGAPVQEDVMRTNTFGLTVAEKSRMALFPDISRFNHDCRPNAFTRFSQTTLGNRAIAFRDIEPGEEITISYIEPGMTRAERQKALLNRWGFQCTCGLCSAEPGAIKASDQRRERLRDIREEVLGHVQARNFESAIKLNEELVGLVVKEDLSPHLGEHYEILARLYLAGADLKNAKRYAQLAVEAMEANGGEESFDSLGELRNILKWQ